MGLSNDLISQFVKTTKATAKRNDESTVYGTTKEYDGAIYVQLDGSELLTPVSTTAATGAGERVAVRIKDHTAMITGNVSFPAAKNSAVESISGELAKYVTIEGLTAMDADIYNLKAIFLTAEDAAFKYVSTDQLEAKYIDAINAKIATIESDYVKTDTLETNYITTEKLASDYIDVINADIEALNVDKLSVSSADAKYVTVDFANIEDAAISNLYAKSGIIKDFMFDEGHSTGELVGVKISGDLIKGNTIVADKLLLRGADGLYYRLNTMGVRAGGSEYENAYIRTDTTISEVPGVEVEGVTTTDGYQVYSYEDADGELLFYCIIDGLYYGVDYHAEATLIEQNEYNSLDGSVIAAKSITADQVYVGDLSAFDATIGGFMIDDESLHSIGKNTISELAKGIYMDTEGQFVVGDPSNYLKYFKDDDGVWKLEIVASSVKFGSSDTDVENIRAVSQFITIGDYNGDACVQIQDEGSDYKQVQTNTATMYLNGGEVKTQIDANGIETENIVVKNELHQGTFAWVYDNATGNYNLEYAG